VERKREESMEERRSRVERERGKEMNGYNEGE
jgi:hypothetical protein